MSPIPFVVMAKPAGSLCNMRCGYCYYLEAKNEKTPDRVMTDAVLEKFIESYIEASPGPVVSFTWHGGEPALAGLSFYKKAATLQQQYLAKKDPSGSLKVWNNLQTNGLLLDEDWCRFLAENHFDVGVSIDGTALCHDFYRKDVGGQGTYEKVAASIRRLQQSGIQPDLLCTVNAKTALHGKEVYRTLRDFGTGWMQFIPIINQLEPTAKGLSECNLTDIVTPDSVTPQQYGAFLKDVFFEWFYHDMGKTEVQLFSETAHALAGQRPTLCTLAPTCGTVLVVEKDGGIYSCDHYVDPEHRLGSVQTDDFQVLLQSEFQKNFGTAKQRLLPDECKSCDYLSLCGGGCQKFRLHPLAAGGESAESKARFYLCEGLKTYFDYAVPRLRQAMMLSQQRKSSQEVMRLVTAEEREKYKKVNRNDPCPCGSGLKFKACCQRLVP